MKYDVVVAGVGGQGVVLAANVVAEAALRLGLNVKQGELHGMSQRGGAVRANLRMADGPIASDLIPAGTADMILSVEPVEALRYLEYLAPDGTVVTSTHPFANIPDYPDPDHLRRALERLPRRVLVDAAAVAREAGSTKAQNTVVLGAAAHLLPVPTDLLETVVVDLFRGGGENLVTLNRKAFHAGLRAAASPARRATHSPARGTPSSPVPPPAD